MNLVFVIFLQMRTVIVSQLTMRSYSEVATGQRRLLVMGAWLLKTQRLIKCAETYVFLFGEKEKVTQQRGVAIHKILGREGHAAVMEETINT
jgi:hypothetical protein